MPDPRASTALTPWMPPQEAAVTQSSTTTYGEDRSADLCDSIMLAFSNNPAWCAARWVAREYPGRSLNYDLIRELAVYLDEAASAD